MVEQGNPFEEGATGDRGASDEEEEELQSVTSGSNGLTFARIRSRGPAQDEDEMASELSFRPKIDRPGSPESTSTPDDTPSIQVRPAARDQVNAADNVRAQGYPHREAAFQSRTAPSDPIVPPRFSRLSAASLRDSHLLHSRLHELPRPLFCRHTPDSLPYPAIYFSDKHQTRQKRRKRHGRWCDGPS